MPFDEENDLDVPTCGTLVPGKTKSTLRSQLFRIKKGKEAIEEEENRIRRELKPELAEQFFALQQQGQVGTETRVNIPVTTRGLGFNTQTSFNHVKQVTTKNISDTDVHAAYRVTLLQLKYQMYLKDKETSKFTNDTNVDFVPFENWNEIFHCVDPTNFTYVCEAIQTVGHYSYADTDYNPFVPKMEKMEVLTNEDQVNESQKKIQEYYQCLEKLDAGEPSAKKPLIKPAAVIPSYVSMLRPDPFLVTIDNLREVVETLSNPTTPVSVRAGFRQYNPIPGASFDATHRLLNPDQIMPRNYGLSEYAMDVLVMTRLKSIASKKHANLMSTVDFTGKGTPAMLFTCIAHPGAFNVDCDGGIPDSDVRCPYPLDGVHGMKALMMLMTEVGLDNNKPHWAIRSPWVSSRVYTYNWLSLVTATLFRKIN